MEDDSEAKLQEQNGSGRRDSRKELTVTKGAGGRAGEGA